MNKQFHSPNLVILILISTLNVFLNTAQAGTLLIDPVAPAVEVGQSITLSVSGASDNLKWTALEKGRIEGEGSKVTYIAPDEVGVYAVMVKEGTNIGTVKITVLPEGELARAFSPENANWEVFTNRTKIGTIVLSEDEKTLWVGTNGGLEQRDVATGQLIRVFTTLLDDLPDNWITALLKDSNGGLWIGTNRGLAYLNSNGQLEVFNPNNSHLPAEHIKALASDSNGGLWMVTWEDKQSAIFHLTNDEWQSLTMDNMGSEVNQIVTLANDERGGLWIGTWGTGLFYLNSRSKWQVFNTGNSSLPSDLIKNLATDTHGGIWIATHEEAGASVVHINANLEWQIFDRLIPGDWINALVDDGSGGVWLGSGTMAGLSHFDANGQFFNVDNSPSPNINVLKKDNKNGLWVGGDGLFYFSNKGEWTTFAADNTGNLPVEFVDTILSDGHGGLWVGALDMPVSYLMLSQSMLFEDAINEDFAALLWMEYGAAEGGLAHLNSNGQWNIFNTDNSELPSNWINNLLNDGDGGLWITTQDIFNNQLIHRDNHGKLTIMDSAGIGVDFVTTDGNDGLWILAKDFWTETLMISHLPSNGEPSTFEVSDLAAAEILTLEIDENGLWIGTENMGLIYFQKDGQWMVLNTDNSKLPYNSIGDLLNDGHGGLWVATWDPSITGGGGGGLVYVNTKGEFKVFNTENSDIPDNDLVALLQDGSGGLWIGTGTRGLVHYSQSGEWTTYDTPISSFMNLVSDGKGGIWIDGDGSIAHLTFSQKNTLARTLTDKDIQNALLNENRAAILIHPRGQSKETGYSQEIAVDFMATYAYHTLHARGYDNDEIYFLSYKPDLDFNGDALADFNVVDAPVKLVDFQSGNKNPRDLNVADVEQAFEWAKTQGQLDQPLLIIFIDHGLENKLLLDPFSQELLSADKFKALLDDYQTATDNKVVVILEACHTGTLVPTLAAPNRTIISSTGEDLAYYNDLGRTSFLRFYLNQLRRGDNLHDGWQTVDHTFAGYGLPFIQQNPQLEDSAQGAMAQNLCLNGCFALPGLPTLTPQIATHQINPGQTIELTAQAEINGGSIRRVWASIITPDVDSQRNEQGHSHLPTPVTYLQEIANGQWQGNYTFEPNATPGEYTFTFKAEDNTKFVTEAQPIIITLGGENQSAAFNPNTNTLHIPAVTVGPETYQAELILHSIEPEIILELVSAKLTTETESSIQFNPNTGKVQIPSVAIGTDKFKASLQLIPETAPLQFRVESITLQ